VFTRLIYLLPFIAPQVLILSVPARAPADPTRPRQARLVRAVLATVFVAFTSRGSWWASACCRWQHVGRGPDPVHARGSRGSCWVDFARW